MSRERTPYRPPSPRSKSVFKEFFDEIDAAFQKIINNEARIKTVALKQQELQDVEVKMQAENEALRSEVESLKVKIRDLESGMQRIVDKTYIAVEN